MKLASQGLTYCFERYLRGKKKKALAHAIELWQVANSIFTLANPRIQAHNERCF